MKKMICLILTGLSFTLNTSAQLQNLDFELCDTITHPQLEGYNCRYLTGWTRTNGNPFSEGYAFNNENGGITDAQNGEMALRLSVWYTYDKDMAYQKAAYTSFPASLSGYYTYTDNIIGSNISQAAETDTAKVTVLLSKWNSVLNQRDTIGFGRLKLDSASSYTPFSCPIDYVSANAPDSIFILLNCSRIREEQGLLGNMFGNNSYFTVDNLSLENDPLDLEEMAEIKKWNVFPNPGSGVIHIPGFTGDVVLFDLNQKLILNQSYPDSMIDTHLLPAGVYVLHLKEKSGQSGYTKYVKL